MMPLADLTHDELDALADGVDDYPASGNKDAKVEALEDAGVTAPDDAPEPAAIRRMRTEQAGSVSAPEPPEDAPAPPVRPVGEARDSDAVEQTPVVDPDGTLAQAKAEARKVEATQVDVRDGSATDEA